MSIVHPAGAALAAVLALVSPAATQDPGPAGAGATAGESAAGKQATQDPQPDPDAGPDTGAAPEPDPVVATAPAAIEAAVVTPTEYARIEQDDTPLRCFATSYSPVYGGTLSAGDVVAPTGETKNGYRAVRLPLGVAGYVHGRFATVGEDGTVTSKGARVAFRYRPNAREAPVRFVDDGTVFHLVAIEGEWLQVRLPDQPAWVPETALVVFPAAEAVDTVVAAWESHVERHRTQVTEAAARLRDQRAAEARLVELRDATAGEWERLRVETAKPREEQDLRPLRDAAAALVAELPEGTPERAEADRLLATIEQQARTLEMMRIVAERPPEPQVTVTARETVPDPLGDYATGWLKVSGGLFAERSYRLEKGGQILFELECTTGRYTLDIFDGMEVAVRGPAGRPDAESLRRLDVQRIEVLARPRQ